MVSGFRVSGVRLDSVDLARESREVRFMLYRAGMNRVQVFVSSSLDEYAIERLLASGAPMNGFGVGAHLATWSNAPVLVTAFKLVEYAGRPKLKLSEWKSTLPGGKQIFAQKPSGKPVGAVTGFER